MTARATRKQQALTRVKEFKTGLKELPKGQRRAAKRDFKRQWRERKKDAKSLPKDQRRALRREIKVEKKIYRRPRRFATWGIAAIVVALIAWVVAPFVSAMLHLTSLSVNAQGPHAEEAREAANEVSAQAADEGLVLLHNESTLPLNGEQINVFGFESFNLRYGGAGSGASNLSEATTLYQALEDNGITPNPDLIETHEKAGAVSELDEASSGLTGLVKALAGRGAETEPAPDYVTDEVLAQAKEYAPVALVVVGNDGAEAVDFTPDQLRLTHNQRDLLDRVTTTFDEVIVVVNSGNQMELGFLDEYPQITAALWIGTPGPHGAQATARVLSGEVNPSGRLPVTYAYDVEDAPAVANVGDYSYANTDRAYLNYAEGIYVGYRFYETYYDQEDDYAQAVQFPFGYGLSYTTFDWQTNLVDDDDEIHIEVDVTNTGDVAGKDVVQIYASAPYSPDGVEKPAIELVDYVKTPTLQPGDAALSTVTIPVRDLASWDTDEGAYVVAEGEYTISVSTDVHTPVETHTVNLKREVFDTDDHTGARLVNRFGDVAGDLTYLSRADWQGTYPNEPESEAVASQELLAAMDPDFKPADGQAPTYGADNDLTLEDLVDVPLEDDRWDEFLDQLTLDEHIDLFINGGWQTAEVERLGIPSAKFLDGPAGLNYFFGSFPAAAYPTEVVIAATWDEELAQAIGEAVGQEAKAYGVQGWYAPGMNLHRSALGGRNFEYFSEDPVLTGKTGARMIAGAENQDITVFMKHFVLNDQEINARSGVNVWVNEQALRELYLRPFEISVKEGSASGAMSSFIHLGPRWAGGHEVLIQDVLRGEWGFEGLVTTDAVLGGFMDPEQAARAGNDIMLSTVLPGAEKTLRARLDDDPVGLGWALRDRVKQILFTVANSSAL